MDDDPYGGFNDFDAVLDDQNLEDDELVKDAVKTSYGNRPLKSRVGTGRVGTARIGTGRVGTGRVATAIAPVGDTAAPRPMTAVDGAGFRSFKSAEETDPLGPTQGQIPQDLINPVSSKDSGLKKLERTVHEALERSTTLAANKEYAKAIEAAKEAVTTEKQLSRLREEDNPETVMLELTFAVELNLGSTYQQAKMYSEAMHTYQMTVKNKNLEKAGRLRVNMGNIYFIQRKYLQAIKMFRMALDQIPYANQMIRNKVMKNIGHAFVAMGQYNEAIASYEHVLDQRPTKEIGGIEKKMAGRDSVTAFNAILCYFALGNTNKMQSTFEVLLQQELNINPDDQRHLNLHNDPHVQIVLDVVKMDALSETEAEEKLVADKIVIMAARLISPAIDTSFDAGYNWCIDLVRQSQRFTHLAAELEITKAVTYLKMKEFKKAIEVLKTFEKTDSKMKSVAATNLSFLYFLESQYSQADKYADIAMKADRYNSHALVNKGNCFFVNDEIDKAIEHYSEALQVDSNCTEALFNLGLSHKKERNYESALQCFHDLSQLLQNSPEVVYQLAHCYELMDDFDNACDYFLRLAGLVRTDPNALAHLGTLFDLDNDKSQAFQYHMEAFRYFPSSIRTLEWLGAYYVESQYPEKAIQYFERACVVQPKEVKWRLMVASCYRRSGNYRAALELYERIHIEFPDNIDCLKFLVRLCNELKLPKLEQYSKQLEKAERAKDLEGSRDAGGRRGRRGRKKSGKSSSIDEGVASNNNSNSNQQPVERERDPVAFGGASETKAPSPLAVTKPAAVYEDPLGKMEARPKTGAKRGNKEEVDEWDDMDVDDDMLPD